MITLPLTSTLERLPRRRRRAGGLHRAGLFLRDLLGLLLLLAGGYALILLTWGGDWSGILKPFMP